MVADCALSRLLSAREVCWALFEVDGLPSWYSSMRFRGMGSWNGGWLLVVGFFCLAFREWFCVQFVGGQVLGPCGLHIPGCGW